MSNKAKALRIGCAIVGGAAAYVAGITVAALSGAVCALLAAELYTLKRVAQRDEEFTGCPVRPGTEPNCSLVTCPLRAKCKTYCAQKAAAEPVAGSADQPFSEEEGGYTETDA